MTILKALVFQGFFLFGARLFCLVFRVKYDLLENDKAAVNKGVVLLTTFRIGFVSCLNGDVV